MLFWALYGHKVLFSRHTAEAQRQGLNDVFSLMIVQLPTSRSDMVFCPPINVDTSTMSICARSIYILKVLFPLGAFSFLCIRQGSLQGSVVLVPIYAPRPGRNPLLTAPLQLSRRKQPSPRYRAWRWSPVPSMPEGFGRQAARLSLLALLAVWRAGGGGSPATKNDQNYSRPAPTTYCIVL